MYKCLIGLLISALTKFHLRFGCKTIGLCCGANRHMIRHMSRLQIKCCLPANQRKWVDADQVCLAVDFECDDGVCMG